MTRLQIGELWYTQGGVLGRRFVGGVLWMAQQIIGGGYAGPTAEQSAWAAAVAAGDDATITAEAQKALKWGLANNPTLQAEGNGIDDDDCDFIVAEYAKTYA